jgi:ABC-2 type transport system permease protein
VSATALIAAERIKLGSVRSPWWCAALAVLGVTGLTALMVLTVPADVDVGAALTSGNPFLQFGLVLVLVLAAVSVTTEYRYSTIRVTFTAAPRRAPVLLAKAVVVALAGAVVGLLTSFAAWVAVWLLAAGPGAALDTGDDWWVVLAPAAVFATGAVLALAVGVLVRQTAAAVSILLVWTLLLEQLIQVVPSVGQEVHRWMPFVNAANAMSGGDPAAPFGPWGSLAWFAAVAAAVFAAALVVADRRDA